MPVVSVIMPVFNTDPKYLKEAIESVLTQTFKDWELVVVNDGSTDQNVIGCLKAYEGDVRIHTIHFEKQQGISTARNTGLQRAHGKYIAFLDSDDVAHRDRLALQVNYLDKHYECGCLASLVDVIGDDRLNGEMFHHFKDSSEIELYLMLRGNTICTSSVMVRKDLLTQFNINFNPKFTVVEDYDFWCQLLGKTKFYVLKDKLISYRYHFNNTTHVMKEEMQLCTAQIQLENLRNLTNQRLTVDLCEMFYSGRPESLMQLRRILIIITKLIEALKDEYPPEQHGQILELLTPRIRNLFYHCKGFNKQLCLLKSPLSRQLDLPIAWRVYCFITRGLFGRLGASSSSKERS